MSDIVPCGQIDGHGHQCIESAKCRQCQEIERLRKVFDAASDMDDIAGPFGEQQAEEDKGGSI